MPTASPTLCSQPKESCSSSTESSVTLQLACDFHGRQYRAIHNAFLTALPDWSAMRCSCNTFWQAWPSTEGQVFWCLPVCYFDAVRQHSGNIFLKRVACERSSHCQPES